MKYNKFILSVLVFTSCFSNKHEVEPPYSTNDAILSLLQQGSYGDNKTDIPLWIIEVYPKFHENEQLYNLVADKNSMDSLSLSDVVMLDSLYIYRRRLNFVLALGDTLCLTSITSGGFGQSTAIEYYVRSHNVMLFSYPFCCRDTTELKEYMSDRDNTPPRPKILGTLKIK